MIVLTIMHRITIIVPNGAFALSACAPAFLRTSVEWFGDGLEPVPRLQAHPGLYWGPRILGNYQIGSPIDAQNSMILAVRTPKKRHLRSGNPPQRHRSAPDGIALEQDILACPHSGVGPQS